MIYKNRLAADLERWESYGFIDAQARAAMLADAERRWPKLELGTVISVLAAVLIILGVITFVSANWQEIPRIWRLAMIVVTVSATYGLAFAAFRASADYLAHAAILVGVGAFGAGIMLISQMYHISGDTSAFLMTWMACRSDHRRTSPIKALTCGCRASCRYLVLLASSRQRVGKCLYSCGVFTGCGSAGWPYVAGTMARRHICGDVCRPSLVRQQYNGARV
jgi:uncharacterized membrane protein